LALANGAGDVITALVSSKTSDGISYNIGALYGAGLFCCSLTISLVILKSEKPIKVAKTIIYRDVVFYLIATILTLIFALMEEITIVTSLLFILLYITLVVIVYYQGRTIQ